MRCPFCGKYSDADVCPFCGLDKHLEEKIRHTADDFYRQGYLRAQAGDYFHAVKKLKRALYYDGTDIRTLNLLGLVYYQTGAIGEAVQCWQKSLSTDNRGENRAHIYMKDLHDRESRYRAMQEAVRLYNEALEQARSGSLDFAVARLRKASSLNKMNVKVQLLLCLCYIEQQRYKKAVACLDKAIRIDPLHPLITRYRKWITELASEGNTDAEEKDIQDVSETLAVKSALKEPDLNEIFGSRKKVSLRNWHTTAAQIGLFVLGAVCMAVFIYTLKIPDELSRLRRQTEALKKEETEQDDVVEQLRQDVLKAQQYEYEAEQENAELKRQLEDLRDQTGSGINGDDVFSKAILLYLAGETNDLGQYLDAINRDSLSDEAKQIFDRLQSVREEADRQALAASYQTAYDQMTQAQQTEDEAERAELLRSAHDNFVKAQQYEEENTQNWFFAQYYDGLVLYRLGRDQEALEVLDLLLERYTYQDEFLYSVQNLQYQVSVDAGQ